MERKSLKYFLREDSGQNLVEHALLAGLIAVVAVAALQSLSTSYADFPDYLLNKLITSMQQ